ncbi:MAG: HNH endonuclease [Acidobacteria bacterium]|nr:HNH endonuclease [Acidobacteriota bacterium]
MSKPHFVRRRLAPVIGTRNYQSFRENVRRDFRRTCAYCLLEEIWAAGLENFEIDHFRPRSLFPEYETSYYNLYWSCHVCNRLKRDYWPSPDLIERGYTFVDLCETAFDEHFALVETGEWHAKTKAAEYTIDLLRLNRPHLVALRLLLADVL